MTSLDTILDDQSFSTTCFHDRDIILQQNRVFQVPGYFLVDEVYHLAIPEPLTGICQSQGLGASVHTLPQAQREQGLSFKHSRREVAKGLGP